MTDDRLTWDRYSNCVAVTTDSYSSPFWKHLSNQWQVSLWNSVLNKPASACFGINTNDWGINLLAILTKGSEITAIDLEARMPPTFWTAPYPCSYCSYFLMLSQEQRGKKQQSTDFGLCKDTLFDLPPFQSYHCFANTFLMYKFGIKTTWPCHYMEKQRKMLSQAPVTWVWVQVIEETRNSSR